MTQLRFDAANGGFRNESGSGGSSAGFHLAAVGIDGGFGGVQFGRIGFDQIWGFNPWGSNGAHVNPTTYAGATQNGQFRYTTPAFNGFKAVIGGALDLNNQNTATAAGTALAPANKAAKNSTHFLVTYANGPIAAAYVNETVYGRATSLPSGESFTNTAAAIALGNALINEGAKISSFAVSYDLGVAKLFLNNGTQKNATTNVTFAKGTSVSATVPFGAVTAKVGMLNDQTALNRDKTSFGVDYALSKRTTMSADFFKTKNNVAALGQQTWVGVRHSF